MIISIDPGINGAAAVFLEEELINLIDMPTQFDCDDCKLNNCNKKHKSTESKTIDSHALYEFISDLHKEHKIDYIVVEKVWGIRGDTPKTAFRLGNAYQSILTIAEVLEIPVHLVAAITWKGGLGLKKKTKEETTKIAANTFKQFDFYTKRGRCLDGRGDAALIGKWKLQHG